MPLPRCRALVFDLDDTLYLERDYAVSGFRHVAGQFFQGELRETMAWAFLKAFEDGHHGRIFNVALAAGGIDPDPELIARMVRHFRAHGPDIRLQPDAESLLRRLPPHIATALITDGYEIAQANKVAALDLRERIDEIVLTDRLRGANGERRWKPHSAAFERVEAALGFSGSQLVYIADNPTKDFLAPRHMGWRTVRIARPLRIHRCEAPSAEHEADATIASLDDLRTVIDWDPDRPTLRSAFREPAVHA